MMDAKIWQRVPFVRLLIPYISGILLQYYTQLAGLYTGLAFFVFFSIVTFVIPFIPVVANSLAYRWVFGAVFTVWLISAGACVSIVRAPTVDIAVSDTAEYTFSGIVKDEIDEKKSTYKTIISLEILQDSTQWYEIPANVLVYIEKDSLAASLRRGDRITAKGVLTHIENPGNPEEFDYEAYMQRRGIHRQVYLSEGSWGIQDVAASWGLYQLAYNLRHLLLDVYVKYGFKDSELAVISALTLGYKADLDAETKQAFSASGAMHILAVSGLHVGVIFSFLNFFFRKAERTVTGRIIKALLICSILWLFAFISGLSPSVERAALMFSLMSIGRAFNRYQNIYNTLSASAFVLLTYNPLLLFELGFQLSYVAVLAIVFFQPFFDEYILVKNNILKKTLQLLTVSIAAQIGTGPLSVFYFHQFPSYFLLTNLFAIPAAIIIMKLAVILLVVSPVALFAQPLAFLLNGVVWTLNFGVKFIEALPGSTIADIHISPTQTILAYLLIMLVGVFLYRRKAIWLITAMACLWGIVLIHSLQQYRQNNNKQIIVFNTRKSFNINFIKSDENVLIVDSTLANQRSSIDFASRAYHVSIGANPPVLYELESLSDTALLKTDNWAYYKHFLSFDNKLLYVLDNPDLLAYMTEEPVEIDYLLVTNNVSMSVDEMLLFFSFDTLVIDATNQLSKRSKWIEDCQWMGIPVHSIADDGAWMVTLP